MKKNSIFAKFYVIIILFLTYIPIVVSGIYSFNESKLSTKWTGFSLKWYMELFYDKSMILAFVNSIILAVCSCILSVIIAMPAAIHFHKNQNRLDKFTEFVSNMPIMIPEIILGMAYLSIFSLMKIPFGMTTLVIAHTTFCIPYIYSQLRAALYRIDDTLNDAALDLGATPYQVLRDITVPLLMPAILSGMLLSFAMSFDDIVISIFVTGPTVNLLPIKVYTKLKTGLTPQINALNTIIPVIILVLLFIRYTYTKLKIKKEKN